MGIARCILGLFCTWEAEIEGSQVQIKPLLHLFVKGSDNFCDKRVTHDVFVGKAHGGNILDTFQDGSIDGPLYSVFRSIHILLLICLAIYKEKGSFDADDMIESAHIFGNLFQISMHNISLLKEIRNREQDREYTDGENSELRPYLYP